MRTILGNSTEQNVLGIFVKFWEPGSVKTRLAQHVGHEAAARIYRAFVFHLSTELAHVDVKRKLFCWPPQSVIQFRECFGRDWVIDRQSDGDLGQRMSDYFGKSFEDARIQKVVLIGSDAPWIDKPTIDSAFAALDLHDVVLGPSEDGGYYLIGMRKSLPCVFENIAWSTESVLRQTIEILHQHEITCSLLAVGNDIDYKNDLIRFIGSLQQQRLAGTITASKLQLLEQLEALVSTSQLESTRQPIPPIVGDKQ